MKLYGSHTSPFVRHCHIALMQSDLEWEMVAVDGATTSIASPSQKVPYFEDGSVFLTDSNSILKYIREKSGNTFFPDTNDYDCFCMVNTIIDSAINLFLLEKDGLTGEQSAYLQKQSNRIQTGLAALNDRAQTEGDLTDGQLRLTCFLEWALFRNRIDISEHKRLIDHLAHANQLPEILETKPNREV